MAGPTDWGAVPVNQPPAPTGPAAWGAVPADASAPAKPPFGSDDYINMMAQKHGTSPDVVRSLADSASSREFVRGIPIAGAFESQAGAGLQAAAAPLTGAGVPGKTISERYAKNKALNDELAADFERENPGTTTAANLLGGVTTTYGAGMTTLGARLLGLTEGGFWKQTGASALSGAFMNALDQAARGGDTGDVGLAAAEGAGWGAVGPIAGRAAGSLIQGTGRLFRGGAPPAVPANTMTVGGVRVPISSGQATGDVMAQMEENAARRGALGAGPQGVAEQFFQGEQAPAVEQARANIATSFDPSGRTFTGSPVDVGEMVGNRVRDLAAASRQNYQGLYGQAFGLPGEIHAGAFEQLGQKIKGDLAFARDPVVIDDVTTPVAARAIQRIDNTISNLRIQNRADPFGPPNPEDIVGVNLAGVDQVRKQLVAMRSATQYGSADQRAMRRIIDAFDGHIEDAMTNGLFTGDDRAVDLLQQARGAFAQHQRLFRSGAADTDVGNAMEKIVGRNGGEGANPNEVANMLYGASKVGAGGTSVRLAQRMKTLLGPDSDEWSAVRQGLWSRLTQATEGTTPFEAQRLGNRVSEFLNGSGATLAQVMFSAQERQAMRQFAELQQRLTPRPGTVNYSNTAGVARMLIANALRGISYMLGGTMGGIPGMVVGHGVNRAAEALAERSAAGRTARLLYRSPVQNAAEQRFVEQMGRYGALGARLLPPPGLQAQQ